VLALTLAGGLAAAAGKPAKVQKHAIKTPKAAKHSKPAKGAVHKSPKVAKRKVTTPKTVKHQTTKYKRHKA
jgi:hypothetical protein